MVEGTIEVAYTWYHIRTGVYVRCNIICGHGDFFASPRAPLIWSPLLLYDNKSSTSNTKVRGLLRVSTSCAHVGSRRRSAVISNNISDIAIARGGHRCVVVRRMRSHTTVIAHSTLGCRQLNTPHK
jgi:hypothetical protein